MKPEEIEQMAKVVEEAVAAGALGFSTSRVIMIMIITMIIILIKQ